MAEFHSKDSLPHVRLGGKRILIASSPAIFEKLSHFLAGCGANLIEFRAVEIRKVTDTESWVRTLAFPGAFSWIIFTSAYGVRYFLEHLGERSRSRADFPAAKICAVGPATARCLEENGWKSDLLPTDFVAEGILEAFARQPGGLEALRGKTILLPRAREARDVVVEALVEAGASVAVLPCYEAVQAAPDPEVIRSVLENPPALMIFTSSSNVSGFLRLVGMENGQLLLHRSIVACLGPIVAAKVRSYGKDPEILPKRNTVEDLVEAVCDYFAGS